jgi:hypothetical protein
MSSGVKIVWLWFFYTLGYSELKEKVLWKIISSFRNLCFSSGTNSKAA